MPEGEQVSTGVEKKNVASAGIQSFLFHADSECNIAALQRFSKLCGASGMRYFACLPLRKPPRGHMIDRYRDRYRDRYGLAVVSVVVMSFVVVPMPPVSVAPMPMSPMAVPPVSVTPMPMSPVAMPPISVSPVPMMMVVMMAVVMDWLWPMCFSLICSCEEQPTQCDSDDCERFHCLSP